MKNWQTVEQLVDSLCEALPPGLKQLPKQLKSHFRVIIEEAFARMDLIPREEFDIQLAVLKRSQEKLHQLEKRIQELEAQQSKM